MKVLVTGGRGFIGSAVVRHLIGDTDHEVLNLDKLTYASTEGSVSAVVCVSSEVSAAPSSRACFHSGAVDVSSGLGGTSEGAKRILMKLSTWAISKGTPSRNSNTTRA